MLLVIILVLPAVYTSDIIQFDWDTLEHHEEEQSNFYDRIDGQNSIKMDDVLESEYGVFVDKRPTFQTQKNKTLRPKTKLTKIKKIPKLPERYYPTGTTTEEYYPTGTTTEEYYHAGATAEEYNPAGTTKQRINLLLKNYLSKLHAQKFANQKPEEDHKGKVFGDSISDFKNKTKNFANKFLSLFTVVKFPNAACSSTSSTGNYLGTCYHETECLQMNGTAVGTCADGYGVCCVFRYSCGATSSQNCTYFESPGYPDYYPPGSMVLPPGTAAPATTTTPAPTPDPRDPGRRYYHKIRRYKRQTDAGLACSISIYKQSSNIQQMRIDFIDLELTGPTNGTCVRERLVITGQNVNDQIPVICGYNTGQHMYVDVSQLMGPLQLSVLSAVAERKRFKIRVCQLADSCSNSNNCLQYYTGVTGVISSFNYDQAALINRSQPGYFNNLNYAICIRKEAGYCSITYTNTPGGVEYPFQLRNRNDNGDSTVPPGQAGVEIFNCPDDYIVIDGVRLCGDKFNDGSLIEDFTMNAPVTDTSGGPIVIPVRTDGSITGRGFRLFYTQNRCPNT